MRFLLPLIPALLTIPAFPQALRVVNAEGGIYLKVEAVKAPQAKGLKPEHLEMKRSSAGVEATYRPGEGMDRNLYLTVPYDMALDLETKGGDIDFDGVAPSVRVSTASGNVRIRSAWRAMRLRALNAVEPKLVAPKGLKLTKGWTVQEPRQWMLSDNKSQIEVAYGTFFVQMGAKATLELLEGPFPLESPVKPPWVAVEQVEALLRAPKTRQSAKPAKPVAKVPEPTSGDVLFRSDVRLVNLSASIKGPDGKPVPGLQPEDFEVLEDGTPQKVDFAGAEEVSANVAFLIDLSGSTLSERAILKSAVDRFMRILRPKDKAALYAIANDLFYVLARLSTDRDAVTKVLGRLGKVSGGSPVYDCIWLAFAEELEKRPGERNALIVISDGLDNQLDGSGMGSELDFKKLRVAMSQSETLVYPVVLDPFSLAPSPSRNRTARDRMVQVAEATGGRVFPARSLADMAPVIEQVGDELRSLYSVAYRPSNQEFNGEWRKVEVRLKKPGLILHARSGYFAR